LRAVRSFPSKTLVAAPLLLAAWIGLVSSVAAEQPASHAHAAQGHAAQGHAAQGHAAQAHGGEAHGSSGHEGEHHQDFNWAYGLLGEKAGVEPSLLWRSPGMPVPFIAQLFNSLLLIGLLVRFAKAPIAKGLAERRQRISRGIDEATAMRAEATEQLRVYRAKLDNLDAEIERVRREMRESADAERKRALEEAGVRRQRLEQEARQLIDRELETVRDELTRATASAALESARELLKRSVSTDDHRRLCDEYLQNLPQGDGTGVEAPRSSLPSLGVPGTRSEVT
jgi:F-type H+-transporting ATPase subunit b